MYVAYTFGIGPTYAYRIISGKRCRKVHVPSKLRWDVWERDDFTCTYCGLRRDLTVDHVIPESRGGPTVLENLTTACWPCNRSKWDTVPACATFRDRKESALSFKIPIYTT